MDDTLNTSVLKKVNKYRKRKLNVDNWADNKRKKLKDAGKAYISRKGKQVAEIKPPEKVSGITMYSIILL